MTHHHRTDPSAARIAWVALGAVAVGGLVAAAMVTRQPMAKADPDSAPDRTARQMQLGRHAVVGRTVTIHRGRDEVYAFWRDFANLPPIMDNVKAVTDIGDGVTRWVVKTLGGLALNMDTRIVEDRVGEEIAWRSVEGSQLESEGRVRFRDAPADRGTEVEAVITFRPILGELGRLGSKLVGTDPAIQVRRSLRRLKMLLETGEIATARNRPDAPAPTE